MSCINISGEFISKWQTFILFKSPHYVLALQRTPFISAPDTKEWKGNIIKYLLYFFQVLAKYIHIQYSSLNPQSLCENRINLF